MGFINIGGDIVHTSAIGSLTASCYTTTSTLGNSGSIGYYANSSMKKIDYILMGEEISYTGYTELNVSLLITSINVLGWEYYEEFKKQNCVIPAELEVILDQKYKTYQIDQKIDNLID